MRRGRGASRGGARGRGRGRGGASGLAAEIGAAIAEPEPPAAGAAAAAESESEDEGLGAEAREESKTVLLRLNRGGPAPPAIPMKWLSTMNGPLPITALFRSLEWLVQPFLLMNYAIAATSLPDFLYYQAYSDATRKRMSSSFYAWSRLRHPLTNRTQLTPQLLSDNLLIGVPPADAKPVKTNAEEVDALDVLESKYPGTGVAVIDTGANLQLEATQPIVRCKDKRNGCKRDEVKNLVVPPSFYIIAHDEINSLNLGYAQNDDGNRANYTPEHMWFGTKLATLDFGIPFRTDPDIEKRLFTGSLYESRYILASAVLIRPMPTSTVENLGRIVDPPANLARNPIPYLLLYRTIQHGRQKFSSTPATWSLWDSLTGNTVMLAGGDEEALHTLQNNRAQVLIYQRKAIQAASNLQSLLPLVLRVPEYDVIQRIVHAPSKDIVDIRAGLRISFDDPIPELATWGLELLDEPDKKPVGEVEIDDPDEMPTTEQLNFLFAAPVGGVQPRISDEEKWAVVRQLRKQIQKIRPATIESLAQYSQNTYAYVRV